MNIYHLCRSMVELAAERGGVSIVVASLALEMADAGHMTRVICGIRNLGRVVGVPGEAAFGSNLIVQRLDDRVRPYPELVRRLKRLISELPRGSIGHVHGCFSFAEAVMQSLRSQNVPYLVSPHGKLSIGMMRNRGRIKRAWFNTITRRNLEHAAAIAMLADGEVRDLRLLGGWLDIYADELRNTFDV